MDDLNGLSWSNSAPTNKPPPMSSGLMFPPAQRSTNTSRLSTPLSEASNRSISPKPASSGDSFANLVHFNSSTANKNLSLLEQQKRLQLEKAKKDAEKKNQYEAQWGGQNNQFWDSLEKGRMSAAVAPISQSVPPPFNDEDDVLAAFNAAAAAPVDKSSHFPVPSSSASPSPFQSAPTGGITMNDNTGGLDAFDDDDPFGLNELKGKSAAPAPAPAQDDDDDFLGLLGKPVSEIPHPVEPKPASPPKSNRSNDVSPMPSNEVDRAIAELVDMGFPVDKSREALRHTASGVDTQAAVSWLLTKAHSDAKQKSQGRPAANGNHSHPSERSDSRDVPAWMMEGRSQTPRSRDDSRSPANADPAQIASQIGSNLLKTAGSLWKTGSKKFQQAVNEFNAEHDPSQPKWMRDASAHREESFPSPQLNRPADRPVQSQPKPQDFTNEAALLESGDSQPHRKPARPSQPIQNENNYRQQQPSPSAQNMPPPNFLQRPSPASQEPKTRLSRFAAEEQSAQAYVSPARRKRPQAPPAAAPEPNIDLFDSPAPSSNRQPPSSAAKSAPPATRSTPIPVRPKAPLRSIPDISAEALQSTHRHRAQAAEAYKRGDYAAAYQSFSTAISMLPDKHPITIMIRSNRAMTALKTGAPKSAIDDADTIIDVIGPSRGESETIELGNGEPAKQMRDFFGKALMRKAEALEQLERWADAADSWKLAVESGHGGSTSIQGRNRCEKAAGISKPVSRTSAPAKKKPTPVQKKASALSDIAGAPFSGKEAAAVSRLREANKAAERADEEKFALSDSVDARIATWRGGKQDNLRALLGSLDSVLWPESGWKKINLSELILPNKVKIQYMKGISKVHPDKIPTTATTEQRMIAGAVFGTLNEAWDKFRAENNL